ncbi:MAG: hypothetical protein FJ368_01655 [Pelagibacterales bacterium]|nr:hypothetical protein [Pelagibacterales bacterium]
MFSILSQAWKGLKFAASATIGIPCAVAASAFVGSAYLLAEATNIVEAKVFHPHGFKLVHKNPFFEGVSNSLYGTLKSIWKDYGAYSHITFANWALQKRKRHFDFSEEIQNEVTSEQNLFEKKEPSEKVVSQNKNNKETRDKSGLYFETSNDVGSEIPGTTVTNPKAVEKSKDLSQVHT